MAAQAPFKMRRKDAAEDPSNDGSMSVSPVPDASR